MGYERFFLAKQAPGEIFNSSGFFGPNDHAIDVVLPPHTGTRIIRYQGEAFTTGPDRAQIEPFLGGSEVWGRTNVALPAAAWAPVSGCFPHNGTTDPARVRLRVRSYDVGASAGARNFRLDAVDMEGVEYFEAWEQDNGVGSNTPTTETVPAGQALVFREFTIATPTPGSYRLCVSSEIQPGGSSGQGFLELVHEGVQIRSWPIDGLGIWKRIIALAPLVTCCIGPASTTFQLRIRAASDLTLTCRRMGLFAVNWDQVLA